MKSRVSMLSRRALELASTLPTVESTNISRWLYNYGYYPRGMTTELDFGSGDNVMAVLGLTFGCGVRNTLEACFEPSTHTGWLSFAFTGKPILRKAACKLYVSPQPFALTEAFPIIARTFAKLEVRSFKVGRGLQGLLRPDKIVAYFDSQEELEGIAVNLGERLKGCPAQGVPFTTEIDGDGLLSWGVDPPQGKEVSSWRSWITKRLAEGMVQARPSSDEKAINAALQGVTSLGVNTEEWTMERLG
jgi:hypothetical protein